MPQLNPEPWLSILIFSWTMFLMFIPQKVLAHSVLKQPNIHNVMKTDKKTWYWPWP